MQGLAEVRDIKAGAGSADRRGYGEAPMAVDKASDVQVGGSHYKGMAVQPSEFCQRNQLNWCESNVIKYVSRHRNKNGRQDIEKAIHYLNLLLEWEYPQ